MEESHFLVNVVAIATVVLGIITLLRLPMEDPTGNITKRFGIAIVSVILVVVICMAWFFISQNVL
ncbi:MAG TPA: hypothetical protein QF761_08050 [Pirellulales bacterium]|jgi:hypothetical protein|nr:hypothetical protein [Pirellulales bacterium]|tara:strand:+ start:223 stop:417 length:195 start_codon:yes stop_codon:yes gene_type:complete